MRRSFLLVLLSLFLTVPTIAAGEKSLALTLRSRTPAKTAAGETFKFVDANNSWAPKQTAIIVCDMWDTHHCYNAVQRVVEIAPRMNEVLEKARAMGVLIIHAPSSCMDPYKEHPARKNAKDAPDRKSTRLNSSH